jgi:transmembrane sensor
MPKPPPKTPPKPPFDLPESEEDIRDPLAREALMWIAHLHSGEEKPEDWAAFEEWQQASDDHRRASARAKRIWDQIGASLLAQRKPKTPKIPIIIAAAIGLAAASFFGGLFGPPASFFADYRSSTGEVRSVVLRDGSEVDLDTGTSFDVSDGDRTITLYTGQVFVKVKPDPERAFVVMAGDARAQALGTAFAVRRDGGRATVLVAESAVQVSAQVSAARGEGARTVRVSAGNAVTLGADARLGDPQSADVAALTEWRRGVLRFENRPLSDVVAELDRYRIGKIVILGGAIRNLPVTGSVDIGKVDQFLASLQVVLPVKVTQMPGLVTIWRDRDRDRGR